MDDDPDELEMPLMPRSPALLASYAHNNGGKASVMVTMVPPSSAYGAPTSSLRRPIQDMTLQYHHHHHRQQQPPPSSAGASGDRDGRIAVNRNKSSANGGFAIKSPSNSGHSSASSKTSAQVPFRTACNGAAGGGGLVVVGARLHCGKGFRGARR